jgi:hypothetical protein
MRQRSQAQRPRRAQREEGALELHQPTTNAQPDQEQTQRDLPSARQKEVIFGLICFDLIFPRIRDRTFENKKPVLFKRKKTHHKNVFV